MIFNELIVRTLTELTANWSGVVMFLANYLGWFLFVSYLLILIWHPKRTLREEIIFVLTAVLAAWVLSAVIKYFYVSPRPFLQLDNYAPLWRFGSTDSFPSSHATTFFAFGLAVHAYRPTLGNLYLVGAVLISVARIAAGLHWPSDVIGGFVLAGITVFVTQIIFNNSRLHKSALRL